MLHQLKTFFKGSSCGCGSTTRKHKHKGRKNYRGGYRHNAAKKTKKSSKRFSLSSSRAKNI